MTLNPSTVYEGDLARKGFQKTIEGMCARSIELIDHRLAHDMRDLEYAAHKARHRARMRRNVALFGSDWWNTRITGVDS